GGGVLPRRQVQIAQAQALDPEPAFFGQAGRHLIFSSLPFLPGGVRPQQSPETSKPFHRRWRILSVWKIKKIRAASPARYSPDFGPPREDKSERSIWSKVICS